ncbi:MAG: Cysteine desulfurase NifS [Chlamydiales bacterium]|nr:Cysteine desulfurase NifS [Chlamydiales bacterium]
MIYLDNNATTFLDPRVLSAMEPILTGALGNPSSTHRFGQAAKALLVKATKDVAAYFGVQTADVVFTSGATEALNMVIRSAPKGSHIVTSSLEHTAVLEALKFTGCAVTYLDPEPGQGAISLEQIVKAVTPSTSMLVVMAANNETGIKTDLDPIAAFAQERELKLVVDGVALLGKEVWDLPQGVTAACFSGHKIHAPTGLGLAIVRKAHRAHPLIMGGPQQRGLRGGTENLAAIVGFAKALTLFPESSTPIFVLRDRFEKGLQASVGDLVIHGSDQSRVCNTSHMAFLGVDGETLLMQLDLAGVAVSHGAACSSGTLEPSRVLLNMGVPADVARSSIRFSLSRFTTEEEIKRAVRIIANVVSQLRAYTYNVENCGA